MVSKAFWIRPPGGARPRDDQAESPELSKANPSVPRWEHWVCRDSIFLDASKMPLAVGQYGGDLQETDHETKIGLQEVYWGTMLMTIGKQGWTEKTLRS